MRLAVKKIIVFATQDVLSAVKSDKRHIYAPVAFCRDLYSG